MGTSCTDLLDEVRLCRNQMLLLLFSYIFLLQVEDTKHEKSEQEKEENQEDIKEEKEGIEMTDDFECKLFL